jgi:hypothetical protein
MSTARKRERPAVTPLDCRHLDELLDQALIETFPASDPVAIDFESPADEDTGEKRVK